MEGHFHEKLTLSLVARFCAMNPFEFSRCFRREQGVTYREYLLRLRVHKAAELLRRPGISVSEAASAVGFWDLSHFARQFRRRLGVNPSAFRPRSGPG